MRARVEIPVKNFPKGEIWQKWTFRVLCHQGITVADIVGSVESLRALPASDVKKRGWRGVMRTLTEERAVVVTNHDEPEAVIISVRDYRRLLALADQARLREISELDALRRRFDERLAVLNAPGAGNRLRAAARRPAKLRGKVKAGASF